MALHTPVLVAEVLELFKAKSGDTLLDATLGHGGHARAYLTATSPDGQVVGIDTDENALVAAQEALKPFGHRLIAKSGHFAYLKDSVTGGGIVDKQKSSFKQPPEHVPWSRSDCTGFTHILFDLGIGSHQLADIERGFSFASDKSLSMRFGTIDRLPPSQLESLNALEGRLNGLPDVQDILERLSISEIAEILEVFGEERFRGRIGKALKERPYPVTGVELAERVSAAVPTFYRRGRLHPATRTFQALRLAVNRELESLTVALPQAYELLAPGGILAVISFHSLEDRIVKHTFRRLARDANAHILTKKPRSATEIERQENPRSRSAKLRGLQKK